MGTLLFLLAILAAGQYVLVRHFVAQLVERLYFVRRMKAHNRRVRQRWHKVEGVVQYLGWNVDYVPVPSREEDEGDEAFANRIEAYAAKAHASLERYDLYGPACIVYRYEVDGQAYETRGIRFYPDEDADLELLNRLEVGQRVMVRYNPKDHSVSQLGVNSDGLPPGTWRHLASQNVARGLGVILLTLMQIRMLQDVVARFL